MRPSFVYNSTDGYTTRGSHHLRFCGPKEVWRCTTTAPVQQLLEEAPFLVHDDSVYIVFGQDESFANSIPIVAREFQEKTEKFWKQWCMQLCLPLDFQPLLVRSAITLMLNQSEECGGFAFSTTMCHPLAPGMKPTKDTRVCTLLDECLSVGVLRDLGLFQTLKQFLTFCKTVCFRDEYLQHTYGHLGEKHIKLERTPYLAGFRGIGEVTHGGVGPAPDSCADSTRALMSGLLLLALSHAWDCRLGFLWSPKLTDKLDELGTYIVDSFFRFIEENCAPSWEPSFFDDDVNFFVRMDHPVYVTGMHTFSTCVMWAGIERLKRLSLQRNDKHKALHWSRKARKMRQIIWEKAWNESLQTFTTFWGGDCVGPSLLRLPEIGFIKCERQEDSHRFRGTLKAFEYLGGKPQFSLYFSTNTMMWYAEALRVVGRCKDALDLVNAVCIDRLQLRDDTKGLHGGNVQQRKTMEAMNRRTTREGESSAATASTGAGTMGGNRKSHENLDLEFLPFWQSIDLGTAKSWGNFPCTPVMLSIIRVSMRLSRTWKDL